ncbi:MAG TPA: hypothetical protein VNJ02_10545 [Vicinamibacterales bacterium]|nr:hypothetical protein [Vicinamibacterales bacterium]
MSEREVELVLRARNVTEEAFKQVQRALKDLDNDVQGSSDRAKGAGSGVQSFLGNVGSSFAGMGLTIGAVTGAVGALAAGVVALGIRGADVADIRGSFDTLNKTIGNDSVKVLGTLKKAFAGTVTDFDLMQIANVALSQKLKLTDADFGLLGKSARVLADRTGGDAKTAFETLTQVMATGKDMALKTVGVNIDGAQAMYDYGKSIGKTVADMNEAEKTDAKGIAIKRELQRVLKESGEAQFDFADAVAASKAMVGNFKDKLSEAIATSPAVNAMLGSIATGLESAFGADSAGLVNTLTGYVNSFALMLVDAAKFGVNTAGFINVAFSGLKLVFAAVGVAITGLLEGLVKGMGLVIGAAEKIPGIGDKFKGMGDSVRDAGAQLGGMKQSFIDQTKEAWTGVTATGEFQKKIDGMTGSLDKVRGEMVKAMHATKDKKVEIESSGKTLEDYEKKSDKLSKSEIKALKDRQAEWKKLNDAIVDLGKNNISVHEALEKGLFGPFEKSVTESIGLTKEMEKELAKMGADSMPLGEALSKGLFGPITKELTALPPKMKGGMTTAMEGLGPVILSAVQGGGNVAVAAGTHLGQELGKGVVTKFGSKILGALGPTLGGAFNAMIPGIGALIGPLAGAIGGKLKSLFGIGVNDEIKKYNAEIDKVRGTLLLTHGTLEQLDAKAKALGMSFKNEWGHQGKAGLDQFNAFISEFDKKMADVNVEFGALFTTAASSGRTIPDALRPAIEHLIEIGVLSKDNALLFKKMGDDGEVDFKKMEDAAKRYGVDLADLGPKFHSSKLHDAAKTIWDDFQLLTGSGASVGGVLVGMQDEISKLVSDSLAFGGAIPENFKPLIANLMASEKGIVVNGEKLTDMSKLQFGPPIVDGFQKIVDKIEELIGKITGPLATAANNAPKVRVDVEYNDPGFSPRGPRANGGDGDGGGEGFAAGGIVNAPLTGQRVTVHGREAIVPLDKPSVIGSRLVREIIAVANRNGSDERRFDQLEQSMSGLAAAMRTMPETIVRGMRDGQLQLGTVR